MFPSRLKQIKYLLILAIGSSLLISCSSTIVAMNSADWRKAYLRWSPEKLCRSAVNTEKDLILSTFTPQAIAARTSLMREIIIDNFKKIKSRPRGTPASPKGTPSIGRYY